MVFVDFNWSLRVDVSQISTWRDFYVKIPHSGKIIVALVKTENYESAVLYKESL